MKPLRATVPWLFLSPFLAGFCVFTLWPLAKASWLTLHRTFGPAHMVFVGTDNFSFVFSDPLFWIAMRNTAVFAAASLGVQLPISLGLAMLLNHPRLRFRAFFRMVFFSPALVGMVFVGLLFGLVFEKRTGLLNVLLHRMFAGFDLEFPWLQQYVMAALIIASLWMYVGFNMIYFLAALQNVPREQVEAAIVDGAGPWRQFWHVVLPEIAPTAAFIALLSLTGSFQLFELPWILLGGPGPDNRGLTVVMYLYQTGFQTNDLGYASAIGCALAIFLFAAAIAQRRLLAIK